MAEKKKEKPVEKKTEPVPQNAETVTTAELAMLFNLSIPSIKKLQQDGVIEPLPNNGNRKAGNQWMPLQCACKVIRNYQKMVDSRNSKDTEEMKKAKERERIAKARQAELVLAEREKELVRADVIMELIGAFLTRLRISLLAIPKGIAPLIVGEKNTNVIAEKIYDRLARVMSETVDFEKKKFLFEEE